MNGSNMVQRLVVVKRDWSLVTGFWPLASGIWWLVPGIKWSKVSGVRFQVSGNEDKGRKRRVQGALINLKKVGSASTRLGSAQAVPTCGQLQATMSSNKGASSELPA